MAAKKKVARPGNNIPKGSGTLKAPTAKQHATAKSNMDDAKRYYKVMGTAKNAGMYGPKSTKKAAVSAIKKSKVKVTTKQKQAVRGGKTTTGRMGTEGKNTRGEARPYTSGYTPDYGRE